MTEVPSPIGQAIDSGYQRTPIARWNVIPGQKVTSEFEVGVVAFHMNGIDYVEFSANGSDWVQSNQMYTNPRTGNKEFWVTLNTPESYAGIIEIRARVIPLGAGSPLVLQNTQETTGEFRESIRSIRLGYHSMFLNGPSAFSSGSTYFVSRDGSDSGPGNEEMPFATLSRAVARLKADGSFEGSEIIITTSGEYEGFGSANWYEGTGWLTIRADDSLRVNNPEQRVSISASTQCGPYPCVKPNGSMIHWVNIGFDAEVTFYQQTIDDELAWFERCLFL